MTEQFSSTSVLKLVGVFVAALLAIEGFEYLRAGVADGTIAIEVAVLVFLGAVGTLAAWQYFRSRTEN